MADSPIQFDSLPETPDTQAQVDDKVVRETATAVARGCAWLPKKHTRRAHWRFKQELKRFRQVEARLYALDANELSKDLKALSENLRLIRADVRDLENGTKSLSRLPAVRTASEESTTRSVALADALLAACGFDFSESQFRSFIQAAQEVEPLRRAELWGMPTALKLAAFGSLVDAAEGSLQAFLADGLAAGSFGVGPLVDRLRLIGDLEWKDTLEQVSILHRTLLQDPSGIYPRMDFETREMYREVIENIATRSDVSEIEVARRAVQKAAQSNTAQNMPDALRQKLKHVGYYFLDPSGSAGLLAEIGYRPAFGEWARSLFRRFPDEIYIIGIEFLSLITVVALTLSLVRINAGLALVFGALLLTVPATQAAVEALNYLVTTVLRPRILPKMDFSKGVDDQFATIVAIPTLLINNKQIRQLVDDLEVRYLANRDANVFFALLTDLPDTSEPAEEQDHRLELALRLIDGLNAKYAEEPFGGFYLFHRHRVYNPREGAWMGWERKRGKLLDLNQLVRGVYNPFPIKAGDMQRLPFIRYVLTLDSDTELPRGSAERLIGAMAHPLNAPVVDPDLNIVTEGYGILQPRVGISVHSSTRSHLASIYSGQTGFDIYSRAISDVYQDLYGEGIFTGKGIYDVDALRQVLEHRFPRNALLSHDLIEGAYARAGLVSDIEVIDDYPTHYSAYNRRRHRWLRGDWQIIRWIFNRVPDESRRLVRNPISLVSRWKIVDNLRRSLVEPATFFLLVCGWFWLPGGPRFWTVVTLALLFSPIYFRLIFALIRAAWNGSKAAATESITDFAMSHVSIALNIAFLAHQALVALDAIIRTIIRSHITHTRLLEWETATEAELGIRKRTPVDVYLDWVPLIAIPLGLAAFARHGVAPYAVPFAVVWSCSKLISIWLNRSPHAEGFELPAREREFLQDVCRRTWQYFAEFSNEANHWLIPDNIQEEPHRVAERLSPTNLGLLLNSRQVALQFGYINLSEFVTLTQRTLRTMESLPRHFGHFLNWYDNLTLAPLEPQFISSVDSGNLAASLWSLKNHCLEMVRSGDSDEPSQPERQQFSPTLLKIANDCDRFVRDMDFAMLVDKGRKLLSVGYNVKTRQLAKSCYDLLASEARTAAFMAVAAGQASQETWFRLGRQHILTEGQTVLVSWTGTMFEYLMPIIWMRSYPNTLLDRSVRRAVAVQQSYAARRRVPWGISEAAYSKTDEDGNYQYAAFGVPGLALHVTNPAALVVSPYSTCLALVVDLKSAVTNLRRMRKLDWLGKYGFYESADYSRPSRGFLRRREYKLVHSWMAHHQGMTLATMCNLFHKSAFQRWFHSEPGVQASQLILQERPLRVKPTVEDARSAAR